MKSFFVSNLNLLTIFSRFIQCKHCEQYCPSYFTVNFQLFRYCNSKDTVTFLFCLGYILFPILQIRIRANHFTTILSFLHLKSIVFFVTSRVMFAQVFFISSCLFLGVFMCCAPLQMFRQGAHIAHYLQRWSLRMRRLFLSTSLSSVVPPYVHKRTQKRRMGSFFQFTFQPPLWAGSTCILYICIVFKTFSSVLNEAFYCC